MAASIFINYRRQDTAAFAGRLFDRLSRTYNQKRLFMDVDAIEPGLDFVAVLDRQVARCRVLLTLIGPNWLTVSNAQGVRRLDDPDDFVRIEIASALSRGIRVIPVLVDDTPMPAEGDLPEPLKPLARRNAVRIRHDRFGDDSKVLIRAVKTALAAERKTVSWPTTIAIATGIAALVSISSLLFPYEFRKISRFAAELPSLIMTQAEEVISPPPKSVTRPRSQTPADGEQQSRETVDWEDQLQRQLEANNTSEQLAILRQQEQDDARRREQDLAEARRRNELDRQEAERRRLEQLEAERKESQRQEAAERRRREAERQRQEAAERERRKVVITQNRFDLPGQGQPNANRTIGDFCCTGRTATIHDSQGRGVGYLDAFDFQNGYNVAGTTGYKGIGPKMSALTDPDNAYSSRVQGDLWFYANEIQPGR